ncbi:nicotinate-nucleotide pyrophosphorylase [carboxylating] [Methylomagnum ishizawai]|uniref:Probable nicotinate-nucleotide pyrophosphorylase [carboxylating] n=1 Tax=Methylomagnum ishizawai TaxID=1760988 RepID=A0A1Y6D8U6_9GAMM|nr:carboxylating nicotinate-nucleotide diphosphorylase [Methylomagnum ishizawai]SMF97153.1 nicotinate-nucleotide pyrophosphorylase [carboxylating] [Methylomagnum ishizawai]
MPYTASPAPADIARFLAEDVGGGDLTAAIIPAQTQASASVVTREPLVLCGRDGFAAVFAHLDSGVVVNWRIEEGGEAVAGTELCTLRGPARALLTGERTALNLLQTLSATATLARGYAQAVAGTQTKVLDTRKTLPGLREAQKYAVRVGGCHNHRIGLYDGILIKENHILAAGSIAQAVAAAKALDAGVMIEVEVEDLDELRQALDAGAPRILLDNFTLEAMRAAVAMTQGRAELEVSGNVTLEGLRAIAETGVDYVSVGALTKNVHAVDLSMRIVLGA